MAESRDDNKQKSPPENLADVISENAMRVLEMPTRQVRVWHNRIMSFLTKHHLNVITVGLLACSAFFYTSIQPVRNRALSDNPRIFTDGETVKITKVIDGDELRIENDNGSTRIRLLGIKSFDATTNDFTVSEYGKNCVDFLKSNVVGKQARLQVSPKGVDNEGRLLGSLFLDEQDLALDLVGSGLTLVYLRFDFARLDEYVAQQEMARNERRGLWSSERVSARAESILRLWEQERQKEEADQ